MGELKDPRSSPAAARPVTASPRDSAVTGLILGIAGMAWFGWGQQRPPGAWSAPLIVGSFAAMAVCPLAAWLMSRARRGESAMLVPRIRRLYSIAVGAEIAACALGAVVLTVAGASGYVAPWVLAVVGAHFVPLARLFAMPELTLAGLALIAAAAGAATGLAPSFTAGAAGGLVCVASAGYRVLAGHRGLVGPGPHAAGREASAAGRQAPDG